MKKNVKGLIIMGTVVLALSVVGIKMFSNAKETVSEISMTSEESVTSENVVTNIPTVKSDTTVVIGLPTLIDLGAGTCIPCKEMVPVLADVKETYKGKAGVNVIDVNDHPEEANKYGIRVIPTQVFLDKDGKEYFRHEGFFSKEEIVAVFDKMGVK